MAVLNEQHKFQFHLTILNDRLVKLATIPFTNNNDGEMVVEVFSQCAKIESVCNAMAETEQRAQRQTHRVRATKSIDS